jgi:hypothetical protein
MSDRTLGTRTQQNFRKERLPQGNDTRFHTRDVGMTKRVVASITFGGGNATGANNTFPASGAGAFAVGDPVLIEGANLNNGFFTVIALDGTNHAFLTLDPPPKAEGPLSVTLRTP